jgi:ribosomal protein S4|tara:strand:- start:3279 stop:4010 length:732 start_codon:yes stop_codon:yes gene_type:complete
MITKKKYRHKPVYKKFVSLKKNVQNRSKLLKFKKRKWQFMLSQLTRISKTRKNNCYYKFYDQSVYQVPRYNNFFSKNYKQNLTVKKSFNLFYGSLSNSVLKKNVATALSRSNQVQNRINSKLFFKELFERRLDVVLTRSHFTLSIMNARQLISHGHVFINNVRVANASTLLKKGDIVTFSKKSKKLLDYYLLNSELWPLPPQYLQISYKVFQILVVDDVKFSNNSSAFSMWLNLNNVIESYKR